MDLVPLWRTYHPFRNHNQKKTYFSRYPNVPTPHRPNVRRIITRNSFEIYEDQMDDLRREAYEEKLQGGIGSMSKMVRDAIDTYLEKRKAEK